MDQKDRNPGQGTLDEQRNPGDQGPERDVTNREADLQRDGNLGTERNRNQPDSERQPGGNRENMNR